MKKQILSTLMATALLSVSTHAMAGQIDGAINADNRFTVAITQNGNVISKYDSPSNYDWRTTQRFSLETPNDLKQCRVNVIVWGDNSVAEGFAGVLKGDKDHIYTGGSGSQGFASAAQSVSTSGGISSFPTNQEITAMAGQSGPAPSIISNPVWGSASNFYTNSGDFFNGAIPSNMAWVKPVGAGTTTDKHWVFSSPCSGLVKSAKHMEGEHFQCYKLEKGDRLKPETITIRDQFGRSNAVLGTPRMLCNPSSKVHGKKKYNIRNKERHLVCYDYVKQQRTRAHNLKINNQFAPDDVRSGEREMFCVPSSKVHTDRKDTAKDTRFERVRPTRPQPRQQRR